MPRLFVPFLALLALVPEALAQGPVQVFVEDLKVELKGWSPADAEALGKALAADLQGAIAKNPAYAPMTYENLESQLRKEKRAELLSCSKSDQGCIQKILDNYGCEERLYGTVRQVGNEAQISLTRYRNEQLVASGAASDYAKLEARAIREAATRLALNLFGGVGASRAGAKAVEEKRLGKAVDDWNPELEAGVVVEFASDPTGALVEVDGVSLCETPCSKELTKGSRRVSLKKARYRAWEGQLDPARTKRVNEKLAPTFGWLTVRSAPAGLAVTLNGKPWGTTPVEAKELDPGPYDAMIVDEKFEDEGQRVSLEAGENEVVSVSPKPKEGALKVSVVDDKGNAVAADVMVDGISKGTAPWAGKLQVGEHAVDVRVPDGRKGARVVDVAYRQFTTKEVNVGAARSAPQIRATGRAIEPAIRGSAGEAPVNVVKSRERPGKRCILTGGHGSNHDQTAAYILVGGKNFDDVSYKSWAGFGTDECCLSSPGNCHWFSTLQECQYRINTTSCR